ncbi:fungal-specific transcription factor domain-containing protein [Talaromyces proteolyticus]|uniref:Fungal-specific transcription factor domain-containing protein n=1 Tax=Talaromyces proteolyticus TaxID=1131652 RepID=A0AAD4KEV3_9EURO|nr:fungal-specific transcription factor domain-containing protein [Talaromyces proteolyticus]KAH8690270.1 fungal-specific transcription factor domain-containing protein [Talaromyces proteolyticus]
MQSQTTTAKTKSTGKLGAKRSRNGCRTCRSKRLKCDETKPACLMCGEKGLSCPGYQRQLKWSTKHERQMGGHPSTPNADYLTKSTPLVPQTPQSLIPNNAWDNNVIRSEDQNMLYGAGSGTDDCHLFFPESPARQDGTPLLECWAPDPSPFNDQSMLLALSNSMASISGSSIDLDGFTIPDPPIFDSDQGQCDSPQDMIKSSSNPYVLNTLTDIPSFLIDIWFRQICPMWSCFDSESNLNRRIALDTRTHNEAVFYALQSMSAVYVLDQLPHLKAVASTSAKQAASALKRDMVAAYTTVNNGRVPQEQLLTLITLGTSQCWTDPHQLGLPLLREAKRLLGLLNKRAKLFSPSERTILSFFNNSCLYWDMLCRTVTSDENSLGPPWQNEEFMVWDTGFATPHPWTGICANIQRLFTRAMGICRRFHQRLSRGHRITAADLAASLRDSEEAKELEDSIRNSEHLQHNRFRDTGDHRTPASHLTDIAEAFRIAALLQLYQTFHDLVPPTILSVNVSTGLDTISFEESTSSDSRIIQLALCLAGILERLPPDSGSRSMQPILYISASTGLKFDTPVQSPLENPQKQADSDYLPHPRHTRDVSSPQILNASAEQDSETALSSFTIQVGRARHFIMKRMAMLEYSLPPRPITVARDLIKAIWSTYDKHPERNAHWLDVMEETGLYTIFG